MPIQQVGSVIFSLPEGYKEKYGSIPSPCIFSLQSTIHCHTIVQILYMQLYINEVEITVNTHVQMFTTKDQSGARGIYIIVIVQVARNLWP